MIFNLHKLFFFLHVIVHKWAVFFASSKANRISFVIMGKIVLNKILKNKKRLILLSFSAKVAMATNSSQTFIHLFRGSLSMAIVIVNAIAVSSLKYLTNQTFVAKIRQFGGQRSCHWQEIVWDIRQSNFLLRSAPSFKFTDQLEVFDNSVNCKNQQGKICNVMEIKAGHKHPCPSDMGALVSVLLQPIFAMFPVLVLCLSGLCKKFVSLLYEGPSHGEVSDDSRSIAGKSSTGRL